MTNEDNKKLKVLVVHNKYKIRGGEDTVFENEVKLLKDNGHSVFTYERSNSEIDNFNIFQKLMLPFNMIFNINVYKEIRKIIRNNAVDIVHVHNVLNIISPSVYYAAVKEKIPVFNTIHNFRMVCPGAMLFRNGKICEECLDKNNDIVRACKYGCYRGSKLQTFIYVLSQKIHRFTGIYKKINFICLTEFNKDMLLRINKNRCYVSENKVFVRGNFSSPALNSKEDIIPFSERKKQNYIVFAGRLDKMKGFDSLIKLYEENSDHNLPKLVVCGPGIMQSVPKGVEYKGILEKGELMRVMAGAMAVILPTKWYEGFPMTITESYSVGTPVLTSNFGNAKSIAIGATFDPDNMVDMKNAIVCSRNFPDDICEKVYDIYLEKYSEDRAYDSLIDIYETQI